MKPEGKGQKEWISRSFPPSNILFFPGQYFSAGVGKQKISPGKSSFHDTKIYKLLSKGSETKKKISLGVSNLRIYKVNIRISNAMSQYKKKCDHTILKNLILK
jgi:hypothetical protein